MESFWSTPVCVSRKNGLALQGTTILSIFPESYKELPNLLFLYLFLVCFRTTTSSTASNRPRRAWPRPGPSTADDFMSATPISWPTRWGRPCRRRSGTWASIPLRSGRQSRQQRGRCLRQYPRSPRKRAGGKFKMKRRWLRLKLCQQRPARRGLRAWGQVQCPCLSRQRAAEAGSPRVQSSPQPQTSPKESLPRGARGRKRRYPPLPQ